VNWALFAVAEEELADAEAYYDAEGAKLGRDFTAQVIATFNKIAAQPMLSPVFEAER
jgi:hypothetical protein